MLDDGGFIQNYTDISDIKKHEELIENQRERFDRVLGDLEAIVFESDLENNKVTYQIPSALKEFWGESSTSGSQEEGYKNLRKDFLKPYKDAFRDHVTGKILALLGLTILSYHFLNSLILKIQPKFPKTITHRDLSICGSYEMLHLRG